MIAPLRRFVSLALLVGWLAPSATALGVGVHLATEHHGPHGSAHDQEIADLVRAATHGHHHDLEGAPEHGHEARLDGRATPAGADLEAIATLRPGSPSGAEKAPETSLEQRRRRAPPPSPREVHCVLLI